MRVVLVVEQLRRRVPGGIGTYARGLLQGLSELAASGGAGGVDGGGGHPTIVLHASRAPSTPDPLLAYGHDVAASRFPGPLLTRAWDRGLQRAPRAEVLHATSLAFPPTSAPTTVLVHDLAFREVPDAFPERGRRWHEAAFERARATADRLVVPSAAVAEQVVAAGVERDRVEVIEEGSDHLPSADDAGARALLDRLGVRADYLLTVSTLEPRKNLRRLMDAYARARAELAEPWPLVVVGPEGWGGQIEAGSVPHGVLLAGTVSDAVLAGLYRGSRCVAYVPVTEGFGLPPVEAMRECVPVVASAVPSLAGAGFVVDPLDVDAIAGGLVRASNDETVRSELVTAGLLRAEELTWRRTALAHVELWRSLA